MAVLVAGSVLVGSASAAVASAVKNVRLAAAAFDFRLDGGRVTFTVDDAFRVGVT